MGGCGSKNANQPLSQDPSIMDKAFLSIRNQFDSLVVLFNTNDKPPATIQHEDPKNISNFIVPSSKTNRDLYPYEKVKKTVVGQFVDNEFKANITSISQDPDRFTIAKKCVWKRPQEFIEGDHVQLFDEDIHPSDIKQGQLGDCYFLGALSALAENPDLIKRLFHSENYQENGLHCIMLCHNGEWIQVLIDDYFPVLKDQNVAAFSKADGSETWVIFLEKAYAKIYGTYDKIESGFPGAALRDLTGAPFDSWNREEINEEETQKLWELIQKNIKNKYVLTASSASNAQGVTEFQKDDGIVQGHCYSLLDCHEVVGSDGIPDKIIQLRNPWGHKEWNGDWCDSSAKWTPQTKNELKVEDKDDGTFWIGINDFIQEYDQVVVCKVHPTYKYTSLRIQGKIQEKITRRILLMRVTVKSHGFIAFSETDEREFMKTSNEKNYKYSFGRVAIGKIDVKTLQISQYLGEGGNSERDTTIENVFEVGDYAIYFEQDWLQDLRRDVTVSAYSENAFEFQEVNFSEENIDQILNEIIAVHPGKVKTYDNPAIKKHTGEVANYVYFQYENGSNDTTLEETLKMKNYQYLEICAPFTNSDQFSVVVKPGQQVLVKYRISAEGEGQYSYQTSSSYSLTQNE